MQDAAQILDWAAWAPGLAGKDDWREAASLPSFGLESSPYAPPGAEEPSAKAAAIPAMLRRRLTPLGRALAEVLGSLAAKAPDAPWVYASRWGDAALATELLTAAAHDEPLSPAKFAASVHNGPASLLSIALGHKGALTALANGPFSTEAAFESAVSELLQHETVILTVAEAKPPVDFDAPGVTHVWGLLLGRQNESADPEVWAKEKQKGPYCAITTRPFESEEAPDPRLAELAGSPADLEVLSWLIASEAPFFTHLDRHAAWVWAKSGGLAL